MRIGAGYDVHRFGDRAVTSIKLGGINVPHDKNIEAHSDGDVVIHAICDALLGALALGDIGQHFPDSDDRFEGVDSRELLRACYQKIKAQGYQLGNVDVTIIAQTPRVAAYAPSMREVLATDLESAIDQVSIKATTTERLGFLGRSEGLAAEAVVLLHQVAQRV